MDRSAWVGALGSSGRPRAQGPTRRLADDVPGGGPTDSNPKGDSQTVLVAQRRTPSCGGGRSGRRYTHRARQQASRPQGGCRSWSSPVSWPQALAAAVSCGLARSLPPQSDWMVARRRSRQGTAPPTQGRGGRHAHREVALDSARSLSDRLGPACLPRNLASDAPSTAQTPVQGYIDPKKAGKRETTKRH